MRRQSVSIAAPKADSGAPRRSEGEFADAVTVLDGVAAYLRERAAPVRFRPARALDELEAVYRLRFATAIEEGWATHEALPDGLERDAYDDIAVNIAGWAGDVLAATARIVLPTPGRRLPTETAFDLDIEPQGEVVDLGRVIVARPYRNMRVRVLAGLLGACWLEARQRGFFHLCATSGTSIIRLYRTFGLHMTPLAPARVYWNEERYPVRLDVLTSARMLQARWQRPP